MPQGVKNLIKADEGDMDDLCETEIRNLSDKTLNKCGDLCCFQSFSYSLSL